MLPCTLKCVALAPEAASCRAANPRVPGPVPRVAAQYPDAVPAPLPCLAGVLQVEALAQLGGICMLDPEAESKTQFFFGGVEKCRWRKPVVPGDCLVCA